MENYSHFFLLDFFSERLASVWIISVISLIYWKWMKWSRAFDQTRVHESREGAGRSWGGGLPELST